MAKRLDFPILRQPNDVTCGATCLHALYNFYGDPIPLPQVVAEVPQLDAGGTLGVLLACHALRRGYDATIYTYNLRVFDPTWFASGVDMRERLRRQAAATADPKVRLASVSYVEFLDLGGVLRCEDLTRELIRGFLNDGTPIMTGLSATWLYRCAREVGNDPSVYDDLHGHPAGHFVVLCGYERRGRHVLVADPLHPNPVARTQQYLVAIDRLVPAILLGILTYDANLLILTPRSNADPDRRQQV